MLYQVPHYINGQAMTSGARELTICNPATGEAIGSINVANQMLVNDAVNAAQNAYPAWSAKPAVQRAKLILKFKNLLDEHVKELAEIVTREHGKTLVEAAGSVQRGIDVVDFVCGIPFHLKGTFAEEVATGIDCYSMHQPLGVCVGITPFNFPAMIPLWMFPMAIACGNTFVLKPSEKDPSCSVRIVELAKKAGIPDGVINIVHGDKETVDALITHPDVKAISFVGSSDVAESIYKTGTALHKRVQAFGGAKNHCIVMPDADLDIAADAIALSAYGSCGERCMAISVAVAVGDIADAFVAKLKTKITAFNVGPGTAANIDVGPLITKQHWERVQSYVELGKKEGAVAVLDGSQFKHLDLPNGFYMGCTLFDYVKTDMKIYHDEIFGPVLCVVRVQDFDEALSLVNEHIYGNGTAIFTRDGYTARMFTEKVQVGMVGVNVPVPVPVPFHSFGGWKRSIFSDIGMYGTEAVRFYTKLKTVTQRWYPAKDGQ